MIGCPAVCIFFNEFFSNNEEVAIFILAHYNPMWSEFN
jgi:hypothetical protein